MRQLPYTEGLAAAQAATPWPEAATAIAGILMVIAIAVAVIVQGFTTARARMSIQREAAYRKLAEESADAQRRTAEQLELAISELTQLRDRTGEVERVLKEVE